MSWRLGTNFHQERGESADTENVSDVDAVTGAIPTTDADQTENPAGTEARNANWYGWAAVDLSIHEGSNDTRLSSIAQNIRVMRSLEADSPITVRDEELAVIGSVLELTDPNLLPQVMRHFSLNKEAASELIGLIHQALTPTPPTPPSHRL